MARSRRMIWWKGRRSLSPHRSTSDAQAAIEPFRDYLLGLGPWAVVSIVLVILQSVAALLPAFVITFTNGLVFGWLDRRDRGSPSGHGPSSGSAQKGR